MIDFGLYSTYFLFLVAVAAAVVFPLLHVIKDPKGIVRSLIGVGALVVVFVICYVLSGAEVTAKYTALGVGESGSKLIGAGLMMFYVALVAAIVGIIYSEVAKALK